MFPLFRSIEKAWVDLDSFSLVTEYDTLLLIVKDFFRDIPMSKLTRIFRVSTPVLAIIFVAGVLFSFPTEKTVEGKILRHIRQNLSSGQKLLITNLYEKVFTKPERETEPLSNTGGGCLSVRPRRPSLRRSLTKRDGG